MVYRNWRSWPPEGFQVRLSAKAFESEFLKFKRHYVGYRLWAKTLISELLSKPIWVTRLTFYARLKI